MNAISKLIHDASPSLLGETTYSIRSDILQSIYTLRNGFTSYYGALIVRPCGNGRGICGLEEWNKYDTWIKYYPSLTNAIWFASDLFGNQFGAAGKLILRLDVETGEVAHYADSVEQWAEKIIASPEVETAYPLLLAWSVANGLLPCNERLVPRRPFVLGGEYDVKNIVARNEIITMHIMGPIASQIRDKLDGTNIRYTID